MPGVSFVQATEAQNGREDGRGALRHLVQSVAWLPSVLGPYACPVQAEAQAG